MAKRKMPIDDKPKAIVNEPVVTEDIEKPVEAAPVKERRFGKVFKCDKLNVREGASFNSTILGTLTHGDEVEIIDEANENFFKIIYKNREAFVASEFIK